MKNVVELLNVEVSICCKLNINTGKKRYCKGSRKKAGFTGLYYEADDIFLQYILQKRGL